MRRSKGFRVSVACLLLLALVFANRHLASIERQDGTGELEPEFVMEDGNGHIELVSVDRRPRAVNPDRTSNSKSKSAPVQQQSQSQSRPATSVKVQGWLQPTKPPAPPARFAPQQIPIDVPGETWWEEWEAEREAWNAEQEEGNLGQRYLNKDKPTASSPPKPKVTPKSDRIVVLGRTSWEDASWLEEELPEWQHAIYVVDDPDAEFTVQENKGKESNVYLQYITDHYPNFPDYMVFLHAHRSSGHVEFPEQDNVLTVQRLQLDFVKRVGYVNMRCEWEPGCPGEVQPFRQMAGRTTEIAFAGAWMRIFNSTDVPDVVAVPCCAQFAITREQILSRPLSDYQAFHRWLMETELDDETSGRVFEYLWHIIFGQDPVFCPSKQQCYMDVYGVEWDPSYDLPDITWVDDSYWDDFDMDKLDLEENSSLDDGDGGDVDNSGDNMYSGRPDQESIWTPP